MKVLRRALLWLLLSISICLPAGVPPAAGAAAQYSIENQECVVYVTRTGIRYHKEWCRYLRYSKIPTTRTKAIIAGYTPCRVCGGSDCE